MVKPRCLRAMLEWGAERRPSGASSSAARGRAGVGAGSAFADPQMRIADQYPVLRRRLQESKRRHLCTVFGVVKGSRKQKLPVLAAKFRDRGGFDVSVGPACCPVTTDIKDGAALPDESGASVQMT